MHLQNGRVDGARFRLFLRPRLVFRLLPEVEVDDAGEPFPVDAVVEGLKGDPELLGVGEVDLAEGLPLLPGERRDEGGDPGPPFLA